MPTIWELDFYSRPVLDEQKKKVWELLICESPLQVDRPLESLFRYAEFCPSNQVNSAWLKTALQTAIAQADRPPDKIRFFRQAMNNMIMKGCDDLGLPAQLSRRTLALSQWLRERQEQVYAEMEGFQAGNNPSVSFPTTAVQRLPDALRGDRWDFVSLEASVLLEMQDWAIDFGEAFPLNLAGIHPTTLVPGLRIFSSRALPLAAWMAGLELACVRFDSGPPPLLILETGVSDRWALAGLPTSTLQTEAQNFEAAKQQANQVHFLAVQSDPQSETFAGFWLLQEVNLA